MQAELIFTGTELLMGEITNSHAQYLGRHLSALGIEVALHTAVGDYSDRLADTLRQALKRSDLIIATGGLGPTTDDITKETVAEVLGLSMKMHEPTLNKIKSYFEHKGIEMPSNMVNQAYIPAGAKVLPNSRGTAPGVLIDRDGIILALLPGPPNELKAIYEEHLEPYLKGLGSRGMVTYTKLLKMTGVSESFVQESIGDLGGQSNPGIAYLAVPGEVHVRISGKFMEPKLARQMVDALAGKVRERLAQYIFGTAEDSLDEVVGSLLSEQRCTVSTAESCSGGLIAAELTNVAGSSQYFMGGLVAYDNSIKENVLGVPGMVLEKHGAVSKETAVAMADGIRKLMKTDLGLAVTGIAGPGGGTAEKPVGLVYIALAAPEGTRCSKFIFPGGRFSVRRGTVNAGLNMIRLYLLSR